MIRELAKKVYTGTILRRGFLMIKLVGIENNRKKIVGREFGAQNPLLFSFFIIFSSRIVCQVVLITIQSILIQGIAIKYLHSIGTELSLSKK